MASLRDALSQMEKSVDGLIQKLTSVSGGMSYGGGRISTGSNFLNNALGAFSPNPAMAAAGRFNLGMATISAAGRVVQGATQMMPQVQDTMDRMSTFYVASLSAGGMSRGQLSRSTLDAMRGGITSPGSEANVAGYLAMRGMMPSADPQSTFQQTLTSVNYAAQYLGMGNERAAAAIEGLTAGSMSARMLRIGIFTGDPRTGRARSQGEIFKELSSRLTGGRGNFTEEQVMESYRRGVLGNELEALGFSEDQKQMFRQYLIEQSRGNNMDLSDEELMKKLTANVDNPMQPGFDLNTSKSGAMESAQDAYLTGIKMVTPVLQTLVETGGNLASVFGILTAAGSLAAGSLAFTGAGNVLGGLGTAAAGGTLLSKSGSPMVAAFAGAKGKLSNIGSRVAAQGGRLNFAGASKLVPAAGAVIGGVSSYNNAKQGGEFDLGGALVTSGIAAGIGFLTGGPGGALAMGAATFGGQVAGHMMGSGGEGGGTDNQGAGTMGQATGQSEAFWLLHPTKSAKIGARYNATHSVYTGKLVWPDGHRGIDYEGTAGDSIHAAAPGIAYVEDGGQLGLRVKIKHSNGKYTFYCHLSSVDVSNEQQVERGYVVGRMGNSGGKSNGVHLHFALSKTQTTAGHENPEPYLRGGANYMSPAPAKQEQSAAGNTPAPTGNSVTSAATGGTDTASTDNTVSASGMDGSAGASNVPSPNQGGASVAAGVESYSSSSHYSGQSSANTPAASEGGENAVAEVNLLTRPRGVRGAAGSSNSTGNNVTNNVSITVQIQKGTDDEARKFAQMLKRALEDENELRMMARK